MRVGLTEKTLAWDVDEKRAAIEPEHPEISIARQCELIRPSRSSYYYQATAESAENQERLRRLDEQYTRTPFSGARRMTVVLRERGHAVNEKRVRRLLLLLRFVALVPSRARAGRRHRIRSIRTCCRGW